MLAPEPGSIFRLLAKPPAWLHAEDVQELRESTEEFSLVLGDLSGLNERIKLLQEEIGSRLDEQNNRTLFTLTLVTVIALPINIVAGFFGMNVGGVPFAENKHGFWLMVLLVAGFTALAAWWAFRRRGERWQRAKRAPHAGPAQDQTVRTPTGAAHASAPAGRAPPSPLLHQRLARLEHALVAQRRTLLRRRCDAAEARRLTQLHRGRRSDRADRRRA
jgi:hypothetical protein